MRRLSLFSYFVRYLSAILLVFAITALLLAIRDVLDTSIVALLYLLPVGVSTAFWGLGPGIASGSCSFLSFNYFFIQPYYTLAVHRPIDLVILLVFLIVAAVISQLVGRAKAGLAMAMEREREATRLYELSTALAGSKNNQTTAQILAELIHKTFQIECVEITVEGSPPFRYNLPFNGPPPARSPEQTLPIQAGRGAMGKICLWRISPIISSTEKRLLETFASQGALALERAWLSEAESRARVLEESDKLKSALLSSVSHELRTPLSTIKASITSLRSGEINWKSSAREELIAVIDDEADHLNMVVGNLLDMSRIEVGALQPKREWNILSEIVGSVLVHMCRQTENYRMEIDIPEALPMLAVDYVLMEQVFTNLLSNSIKYAPENTVIHIQAQVQDDTTVLVKVSNQGPHVPEEDLERIFDKFYRITAADRVTGIGLGLSICKGIIESHAGRIWAENLSDGFAFNFTLPLSWDGAAPPALPVEPEGE